jgi:hypothetical protein
MSYRVDWFEDNIACCWGFNRFDKAWDKYVEGVAEAQDEVCIYNFAGGKGSAVLLARHYFNRKGLTLNGTKEKESNARVDRSAEAQISPQSKS